MASRDPREMAGIGMKLVNLYGNNMSVMLPSNVQDVSVLREIPDHQEVYAHPDTDQSIIIEILEHVQEPDEEAIKVHFADLANSNDASEDSKILTVENISVEALSLSECRAAYFVVGEQLISKFNEQAKNKVAVYLALLRLPDFGTDILATFNDPVNISPQSSSFAPAQMPQDPYHAEEEKQWTLPHFRQAILSLKLHNKEFLG